MGGGDSVPEASGAQTVTLDLLVRLARRPALVRLLRIIQEEGGAVYTRRLLRLSGSWKFHERILELAALKLIRRVPGIANGRAAVWNEITPLGRKVLALLWEEGEGGDGQ